MELYKTYRPKQLAHVIGQDSVCKSLQSYLDKKRLPHCILFYGPSGCGKTTLARIIAKKIGSKSFDCMEMNIADIRGINDVRDIKDQMDSVAMYGKTKTWILDEVQAATHGFQEAFLKMTEDTPDKVYFMLCTTHPQKIITALRNRCTQFEVKAVDPVLIRKHLKWICHEEDKCECPNENILDRIIELAMGSVRHAIQSLEKVLSLKNDKDRMEILNSMDQNQEIIHLCRLLIKPRASWKDAAKILNGIEGDPEPMRYVIQAYFRKVLLGNNLTLSKRACRVIETFSDSFYQNRAGFDAACFDLLVGN